MKEFHCNIHTTNKTIQIYPSVFGIPKIIISIFTPLSFLVVKLL